MVSLKLLSIIILFTLFNSKVDGLKILRNSLDLQEHGKLGGATMKNPKIFDNNLEAVTICFRFKIRILATNGFYGYGRIITIGKNFYTALSFKR